MKTFEMPNVEVVEFEVKDILTTSGWSDSDEPVGPIDPELPGDDFED